MSVENLKEYARRCVNEPALRERAKQLGLQDLDGQMHESASLGLDWNRDDLAALNREVVDAVGEIEDLSEEDLEKVAGGIITTTLAAVIAGSLVAATVAGIVVGAGAATVAAVVGEAW